MPKLGSMEGCSRRRAPRGSSQSGFACTFSRSRHAQAHGRLVDFPEDGRSIPEEALRQHGGPPPFIGATMEAVVKDGKAWYPCDFWKREGGETTRVQVKPRMVLVAQLGSKGAPDCAALLAGGDRGRGAGRQDDSPR